MEGVRAHPGLTLQLIATGAHLSPEFGSTHREIEADGFRIDRKVDMQLGSDTPVGITKSMSLALSGCADAFDSLQPDLVVVLGDRYEVFAAAAAAMIAGIPIAHVHGGESTEAAIDEAMRHAITKMSHLHFVAAEDYRRRVIQLGEAPDRVHLTGGLGVDAIRRVKLMDRAELEASLEFNLGKRSLLVTFHPVTLEPGRAEVQMGELLAALDTLENTRILFTMPNADADSRILFAAINRFVESHDNAAAFTSLGQRRYLSAIAQVDAVVGNSSSGLAEVPSFRKPTVNIGDRQGGRLKAASVIDCPPDRKAIRAAIDRAFTKDFQATLPGVKNPYGEGGASEQIVRLLATVSLDGLIRKRFHNLPIA
jgi:GDP/UDP-N,N'-diacetylbacillosamine 2-epimerase (hydrolysing)